MVDLREFVVARTFSVEENIPEELDPYQDLFA